MARRKGSASVGPTRSMRLPLALDNWFAQRLARHPEQSPSEVLVSLVHGGLRLRDGYMAIHRHELEGHIVAGAIQAYHGYLRCLRDTFGTEYVDHLERWLAADHLFVAADNVNQSAE